MRVSIVSKLGYIDFMYPERETISTRIAILDTGPAPWICFYPC